MSGIPDELPREHLRVLQWHRQQAGPIPGEVDDVSVSPGGLPAAQPVLPVSGGPIVGREAELARLGRLLADADVRVVTLTGPPGVGKTTLALAAAGASAELFADGVAFVELTAVRDPDLVATEITAALRPGATGPERPAGPHQLLVLDNFEHVLPAAPAVAALLAAHPRLHVLVTSRERLHLRTEHEVPVPPLALPEPADVADLARLAATPAVDMLVRAVRTFEPDFAVTAANREALAEICVRLDGLPLALELAAPRLRLFSPGELTFRLRNRLGLLTNDAHDVPERHRTLRSALAWSHDLLGPDERVLFRQLAAFSGGWTLAAAVQVCAVADAVSTTASLVDKSLVRRIGTTDDAARFGMLESLREFAAELLESGGEARATADRHALYYAELAAGIDARIGTPDERVVIEGVGHDVGNLRAALGHCLAHGRTTPALQLASALGWYSYTRGQLGAGQQILEQALTHALALAETPSAPPDDALAALLFMAGAVALSRGDLDLAEARLGRSLELSERIGAVRRQAIVHAFLGHLARARGAGSAAVAHHERAGDLHQQLGNTPGVAWSRYDLGLLARRRRDSSQAAQLLGESLSVFRDLQYPWAIACSAWALATVDLRRGRPDEAAALLAEALDAFEVADDARGVAQCLEAIAAVAADRRAATRAAQLLGAAAVLRDRLDAPLPAEEQGAHGAVVLRLRHDLGMAPAEAADRAGRSMSEAQAVALARAVVRPSPAVPEVPHPAELAEPSPLTKREHDVALLVRHGRTNRQIGRQLGITERTAEVHVHHIIRKLGASSRAEIAAWVAAGGSGSGS
ncbi:MAG: hypothetical protein QOJ68_608 [Blastococcus sp.]|jgi:predicted ATPase/DNA-binding NarL/FixJ family response regulator|nr:hypothetical protein [Blastococcus sp.]